MRRGVRPAREQQDERPAPSCVTTKTPCGRDRPQSAWRRAQAADDASARVVVNAGMTADARTAISAAAASEENDASTRSRTVACRPLEVGAGERDEQDRRCPQRRAAGRPRRPRSARIALSVEQLPDEPWPRRAERRHPNRDLQRPAARRARAAGSRRSRTRSEDHAGDRQQQRREGNELERPRATPAIPRRRRGRRVRGPRQGSAPRAAPTSPEPPPAPDRATALGPQARKHRQPRTSPGSRSRALPDTRTSGQSAIGSQTSAASPIAGPLNAGPTMPTTATSRPLRTTGVRRTSGDPPNCRSHSRSLMTATAGPPRMSSGQRRRASARHRDAERIEVRAGHHLAAHSVSGSPPLPRLIGTLR